MLTAIHQWVKRRKPPAREVHELPAAAVAPGTLHLFELLQSVDRGQLPVLPLNEVVAQLCAARAEPLLRVHMHPALVGRGSGSVAEMAALAVITAAKCPQRILEFGTFDGCSTWHLWSNSPADAQITSLDLPADVKVAGSTDSCLQGIEARPFLLANPHVRVVETDSRHWLPDLDGPVDLCFIDAGHSYECVRNDTEKVLTLLAPTGIILWHDATWTNDDYAVNRYLRELRAQGQPIFLLRVGAYDYCALAIRLPHLPLAA